MNTAVTIVDAITRTVVELAFIGAGLKLALAVAPRFQVAAPKAPVVRVNLQPETVKPDTAAANAEAPNGTVPAGGAS